MHDHQRFLEGMIMKERVESKIARDAIAKTGLEYDKLHLAAVEYLQKCED